MTEQWIVEARINGEPEWKRWQRVTPFGKIFAPDADFPMEPTTLEACVARVNVLVAASEQWPDKPVIDTKVLVRLRNLETGETIPADVFGL